MKPAALLILWATAVCAQNAKTALVVTPHAEDYVLAAGGTIAQMSRQGAKVYVLRVTNDEKAAEGITPEEAAFRGRLESAEAGKALGVTEVIALGYREGELAVAPTELRDRILFYIRRYKPETIFLPNPYAHFDDKLDHMYAGLAAEEARWAAARKNFQPPLLEAGLTPHYARELYYYALPVDPERNQPESSPTFAPQPKRVDIRSQMEAKLSAARALKTRNRALAADVNRRLARTGKQLPEAAASQLLEQQVRGLGTAEEFLYAGGDYGIPAAYRK